VANTRRLRRRYPSGVRQVLIFTPFLAAYAFAHLFAQSAVVTGDFKDIEREFDVSEVVVALTVTLMVVGFGWVPVVKGKRESRLRSCMQSRSARFLATERAVRPSARLRRFIRAVYK
jgi:hypothetical protein